MRSSPFRSVVQAWSLLDFYEYRHLHAEGYEKYFGWPDDLMTAEKILEIVHPDDREAFGTLYSLVLQGLQQMPIPVREIGHFCISYRIRRMDGNYVKILETNSIVASDPNANIPLICLSQMSNIGHLDRSQKVEYYFRLFSDCDESIGAMTEILGRYSPVVNVFTETDIRILQLIRQGLTSREIAETLFLSRHAIDKRRKKMLKKTGCANSAQLIKRGQDLGFI